MELKKSKKENEVYSYKNKKAETLWMYRHKFYDPLTGKRKEKKKSGFTTEKAAIKALLEVKALTLRGEMKSIENDNLTISQWLDIWYESNAHKWKDSTRRQREMAIRVNIKPLIGHYKIVKLDRLTYERVFIRELEKTHKHKTVKHIHTIFKSAINAAVDAEIILRNRFRKVAFTSNSNEEEQDNKPTNYLSPAELNLFLDTAKETESETTYNFFLTIAYTGMRIGEALGLQWKNIDFTNKTITIERTRDYFGPRSPKTKNSYRTVLVDENVMKQLKAYKTLCKQSFLSKGKVLVETDYVFIMLNTAEIISHSVPTFWVKKIQKAAGLVTVIQDEGKEKIKPRITIHGLRHTHATILMNSGQSIKVIAERLGNTSAMIYTIYGHVMKELEQQSVDVFSGALNAIGAKNGAD